MCVFLSAFNCLNCLGEEWNYYALNSWVLCNWIEENRKITWKRLSSWNAGGFRYQSEREKEREIIGKRAKEKKEKNFWARRELREENVGLLDPAKY